MPEGLNFEDEYNDVAASLQHFDGVLKRITEMAAQAPDPSQVASLPAVDSEKRVVSSVAPEYPAIAKAARIEGTVVIQAVLSKEGAVTQAEAVSGPQLLRGAALAAVTQWKYRPFLLNGAPVPVRTEINVVFTLGQAASAGQAKQP
jgi:protein TonB